MATYDEKPKPGDLIEIFRGSYEHWAVYVGDDFIVHLASSSDVSVWTKKAIVKKEKLMDVVGTKRWKIQNSLDKKHKPRSVQVIVREACAKVGEELPYFDLMTNCEHFANELRYGKAESWQYDEKPELGDLIEIFRGSYQHWAVYVGDSYIVHLTSSSDVPRVSVGGMMIVPTKKAIVKKEKLMDVVGTKRWKIKNSLDKKHKPRSVQVIVREACAKVGEELPYSVFRRNCEHFANELRYGKAESWQYEMPELGDLIEIFRGSYEHWAVYVGDDFIVHLASSSDVPGAGANSLRSVPTKKAMVKKEKLRDVVGTNQWKINNRLDKKYNPLSVQVIVREACAKVGKKLPYSVLMGNCEHFANELRYGKAESRQVLAGGTATGLVLGMVALALI